MNPSGEGERDKKKVQGAKDENADEKREGTDKMINRQEKGDKKGRAQKSRIKSSLERPLFRFV